MDRNLLVSIITPVYNCESYIGETIESVLAQTYTNWELLLVDDCSPDNSIEIADRYVTKDARIKYIKLEKNGGAARARNAALKEARGRFIAYLDADDLWYPKKLERQLDFMIRNQVAFSCCDYEKIEYDGTTTYKIVHMPRKYSYDQYLHNTIIQTVGVIIDTEYVDRELLVMPDIRRGQDCATWLQVLRSGIAFYGQNEVLAKYRRVPRSLSANKFSAMKRTWHIFRNIEKLPLIKAAGCMVGWAFHASMRRIYVEKFFHRGKRLKE